MIVIEERNFNSIRGAIGTNRKKSYGIQCRNKYTLLNTLFFSKYVFLYTALKKIGETYRLKVMTVQSYRYYGVYTK